MNLKKKKRVVSKKMIKNSKFCLNLDKLTIMAKTARHTLLPLRRSHSTRTCLNLNLSSSAKRAIEIETESDCSENLWLSAHPLFRS
jgi:hypothetical protein